MSNKYHSRKTLIDGITFDSYKEAARYRELMLLQRASQISDLRLQVRFELLPAQCADTDKVYVKGPRKGQHKRRRIEQSVVYVADFVDTECDTRKNVVEDTKGVRTKDYIIKRKLFRWRFGGQYEFREV